jgi:hypothetical protein
MYKISKIATEENFCRAPGVSRASGVPGGPGPGFSLACSGRKLQPTVKIAWEKQLEYRGRSVE